MYIAYHIFDINDTPQLLTTEPCLIFVLSLTMISALKSLIHRIAAKNSLRHIVPHHDKVPHLAKKSINYHYQLYFITNICKTLRDLHNTLLNNNRTSDRD